ncbi:MAG: N-acetyltransferase family protein [Gemmatimonadota bacterium]|nr:N-acetyltransferase family protein [Gemmatimonadota bacterium]
MSPVIRVATTDDASRIAEIYAPAVLERVTSFELKAPTAEEMSSRITKVLPNFPWLVCEYDGKVIGYAYAAAHHERAAYRWSVDVAAYVSGDAHRRGVGTALYTSLFEILALQGYRNACAGITLPNPASEGMHSRAGFVLVGVYHHVGYKFGAWHDVAWFERAILPAVKDPPEPTPFAEMRNSPQVASALAKGQRLVTRIS